MIIRYKNGQIDKIIQQDQEETPDNKREDKVSKNPQKADATSSASGENSTYTNDRILTSGHMPEFDLSPAIYKKSFSIDQPSLESNPAYDQAIKKALGERSLPIEGLQNITYLNQTDYTAVYSRGDLIGLENNDTTQSIYGLAVDIGTTTVVVSLVDLLTGQTLNSQTDINQQMDIGMDVLSRLTHVMTNPKTGVKNLQTKIVNSLQDLGLRVCGESGVESRYVYEIVVSANTIMQSLLLGVDPSSIGRSPYAPVSLVEWDEAGRKFGFDEFSPFCRLVTLPGVSSYIGSDLVSGLLVSRDNDKSKTSLLVDIGTNCEIILTSPRGSWSCSCPAGPALEGMNISKGMRAADGAVEDVWFSGEDLYLAVIGQVEPIGICGSGILAIVRELVKTGLINSRGRIINPSDLSPSDWRRQYIHLDENKKRSIRLIDELFVTQSDIRAVQLAKGAISSGISALLNETQTHPRDVDDIVVAGQFGKHVSEDSLIGTGLLPEEFRGRVRYIGNSSHSGAKSALKSTIARDKMSELAGGIDYLELSVLDGFDQLFAKSSLFPDYRKEQDK